MFKDSTENLREREPGLSIVIPVYRSERILPELAQRLGIVLSKIAPKYEVVLVTTAVPTAVGT